MTEKIGGDNTGAAEELALCERSAAQALPVRWLGGNKKIRGFATPLPALGIEAEILFCFKKDCSGKPDPQGNALNEIEL